MKTELVYNDERYEWDIVITDEVYGFDNIKKVGKI